MSVGRRSVVLALLVGGLALGMPGSALAGSNPAAIGPDQCIGGPQGSPSTWAIALAVALLALFVLPYLVFGIGSGS